MTDVEQTKCKILPKLADHSVVWAQLDTRIPASIASNRKVWQYAKADRDGLKQRLREADWSHSDSFDAASAAVFVRDTVTRAATEFTPQRELRET